MQKSKKKIYYSRELGEDFINDNLYVKTGEYNHTRYCMHRRCIQFIESFLINGKVDWTPHSNLAEYPLKSFVLRSRLDEFVIYMETVGIKHNTKAGYRRLVYYFLLFMEEKGYSSFLDLRKGDIIVFIVLVCKEHYQPTSLGAHLPGLKLFFSIYEDTVSFLDELPEHLPKKINIIDIYSDEEYDKIYDFLENGECSLRNKAISLIALDTGLRSIDIYNLKLKDIDWKHDLLNIIQKKTGKRLVLPLSKSVGNALVDYLLSERPLSDSEYVFLSVNAPFSPIRSHSGLRKVLKHIVSDAGVDTKNRINGTRITRHSTASRMLRHGVPLSVISELLGHGNPNSVMIYLTTDDATMAECTLPLPNKERKDAD